MTRREGAEDALENASRHALGSLLAISLLTLANVSGRHSTGFGVMTRNRTFIDIFSAIGAELMIVLLLALATGLAVSEYVATTRDRMRRFEMKVRRRAARRFAA